MARRRARTVIAPLVVVAFAAAPPAHAAVPHTVQPGETLSSIAAANNFTTGSVAAYNGLSEDSDVYVGETVEIPTEAEGAASLASPTPEASVTAESATQTTTSATAPPPTSAPYWTSPIYCPSCPSGEAYLASNAAANWDAMRQESLRLFGIDLYPAGPLSAYRSYAQQLYLYDLYLAGEGELAAVPGTSSHEYGVAVDLADPSMRTAMDEIGARYGWAKTEAPGEWWHVNYVGP
jgi:LysM repeat protein